MNAPQRSESWRITQGENRVAIIPDAKTPNTATFMISKEDHTIGNLLRMQLLRDPSIYFVGYRMPHPLVHKCEVKIRMLTRTPQKPPVEALLEGIDDLQVEIAEIIEQFNNEFKRYKGIRG